MDRGVPLDRQENPWRVIDNLHYALRDLTPFPSQWNEQVNVEQHPDGVTFEGAVHDDRSMTLSGGTYAYLRVAFQEMYVQRAATDPRPDRDVVRRVRSAVGVFVDNYVALSQEPAPDDDAATSALDTGLRANTTAFYVPRVMADLQLDRGFPDILDLPAEDEHPRLQGAVETLCEQVGEAARIAPDDLRDRLQATPPAERWNELSEVLIQQRLGARLDRGYGFAGRVLPEDAARIKALLVKDLKTGFEAVAASTEDSRSNGQTIAAEAVERATEHLDTFANSGPKPVEPPPHRKEPAYAEVSAIVERVHRDLAIGRTGDHLAWVLTPGHEINGWNGYLEATNRGIRDLGEARPDGSLAFDVQRVLAPLEKAHTAPRPLDPELRADVRQAFVVVAREAARLCSPSDPGSQHDPAAQAMEDALVRRYAEGQADRLMTDLGYGTSEAQRTVGTPADRTVAVLTQSIGQISRMSEQQVVSQLLTTGQSDRFAKAVALGLGKDTPRDAAGQQDVHAFLVPKVQAAFAQVARPESRFGFRTGNRGERAEKLCTDAVAEIAQAKDYYASLPKGGGGADLQDKSQAAAMTGQPGPGSHAAAGAAAGPPLPPAAIVRAPGNERDGR
ncbi:hypothetical protein EV646_103557 [Kribbella antiqua]|uniref:Uncharacterized protein n=1 Tax=Kribbella antiqua TaxID=2512217 RepID=A0A4R2J2P6_9ACTN|nr:hypothetical protein [Kribbella antiqua]TCO49575.1 hypothetical protein EV646_103557 [Kribbella antiqua]